MIHLFEITKEDIIPLIKRHPEVLSRLSKILVTRQRETAARKRASSIQVAQAEQIEPTKNKETNNDS